MTVRRTDPLATLLAYGVVRAHTYLGVHQMIKRAVAVLGASALAFAASAGPAMASKDDDYEKYDRLKLTLCKEVKHDDDDKDKDKKDKKFVVKYKTDKEGGYVKLRDGECKEVKVKFDKNKVKVSEEYTKGYELKNYRVPMNHKWDTKSYYKHDDKVEVKYKDKDYAKVKVVVVNEKKDKDKYDH